MSKDFADLRSHNSEHDKSEDMREDEDEADDDEEDLDVKLDKAASGLPVEAAPRVEEADGAGAAEVLRHDFAVEGAVERHDGGLLVGDEGCLDADLRHHGGKRKEQRARNGDDDDESEARDESGPLSAGVLANSVVDSADELAEEPRGVEREEGHGGAHGSGQGENLPGLARGDTLPE